jgi:antirestriction protein
MKEQPPTAERAEQPAPLETKEQDHEEVPRIYVASLSDYNAGRLYGTWINANQEPEELWEAINGMLAKSRESIAEEIAIHDYEGFEPLHLSESESIEHVSKLARGISEHGRAFAHWAAYIGASQWDQLDDFENRYLGHWRSMTEIADRFFEDQGVDLHEMVPALWRPYVTFDVAAFARDLCVELHVVEDDDGVHVFQPI